MVYSVGLVGRIVPHKSFPDLILKPLRKLNTFKLNGKGELRLEMECRLLISRPHIGGLAWVIQVGHT